MLRLLGLILLNLLIGCANEEPAATKVMKQMESGNAVKKKVLVGWNEPISSIRLGLAPNPNIDGKSLAEVITSQKAGRDDGLLCSSCHHKDEAQGDYGVPAPKNGASPGLLPTDMVLNRTWVGPNGWAERFVKNSTKPANLKAAVQAWMDNNYK
ncbi:MAG TPA: hypothetical protein VE954_01405 [Oligoflexus sp.]|uniref:hypothetical protein n=1 Tax=Oligoflexus sp. TaxID=1971216 RepID=UPI002D42FBE6|nr:hypothetical protein [Oligoflexus sp.]HYX31739.1 hypothetical protein [Oligoflexus sp.]